MSVPFEEPERGMTDEEIADYKFSVYFERLQNQAEQQAQDAINEETWRNFLEEQERVRAAEMEYLKNAKDDAERERLRLEFIDLYQRNQLVDVSDLDALQLSASQTPNRTPILSIRATEGV